MMGSFGLYSLLLISAIFMHFVLTNAQSDVSHFIHDTNFSSCGNTGNYANSSRYRTNINALLSSLSSPNATFNKSFLYATAGENSDKVYGLALCRGDVESDVCRNCVHNASQEITKRCPNQKEAIMWFEYCMIRYSNRSILSKMEMGRDKTFYMMSPDTVSNADLDRFKQVLGDLMDDLMKRAAFGSSSKGMFAKGRANVPPVRWIFGLMQCTPDISPSDCNTCLQNATNDIPYCCAMNEGARVIKPSCHLRYERGSFFIEGDDTPKLSPRPLITSPPPQTTNKSISDGKEGSKSSRTQTMIIIIIPTVFAVAVISVIYFFSRRRKAKDEPKVR